MANLKKALVLLNSLLESFNTNKVKDMYNTTMNDTSDQLYNVIDCHAHLTDHQFSNDLDICLKNAIKVGVSKIIAVAETYDDCVALLQLKSTYPDIIEICCGMHPEKCDINELDKVLSFIDEHHSELIGIGECGLDYTPKVLKQLNQIRNINDDNQIKEEMQNVFQKQIEKAIQYDLPLNVHSRSAGHYAIDFLSKNGAQNVLFHAFDGRSSYAVNACKNHQNYFFSIPPSIHRSKEKRKLAQKVPLEHMLLETDSPALGPIKAERNVPQNITYSIKYIADINKKTENQIRKITTNNALRLFKKLKMIPL